MARFGVSEVVIAASTKPEVAVVSDGNIDLELVLDRIVATTAPDDHQFDFTLCEISTIGTTGTACTVKGIGPGGTSAATAKQATWAADPTIVNNLLGMGLYRRGFATFQAPFGEGIKPKNRAANKGLENYCDTAGTGSVSFRHTMHWYE